MGFIVKLRLKGALCNIGGMMLKKVFKSIDYSMLIIAIILFAIGIVALYSANGGIEGDISDTIRQSIWFAVGFVLMFLFIIVDVEIFGKLWIPLYILTLIALVGVLFTSPVNGATSWYYYKRC